MPGLLSGSYAKAGKIVLYKGEITLNGGEIQLLSNVPGKIYLSGMPFELKKLALVDGVLEADLEGEVLGAKYSIEKARISPVNIAFEAKLEGSETLPIEYKGIELKDATIKYDSEEDIIEGEATVGLPKIWKGIDGFQGAFGLQNNKINRVGLGASFDPGLPLGNTSLSMTRLYGEVDKIVTGPLNIKGETDIAAVGGIKINDYPIVSAKDVTVTIDFTWKIATVGDIYLFDYKLFNSKTSLSSNKGLDVESNINLSDILTGTITFKASPQLDISGSTEGAISAPEDWKIIGGKKLAGVKSVLDKEKISTGVDFLELFDVTVKFYYSSGFQLFSQQAGGTVNSIDGHRVEVGTNLELITSRLVQSNSMQSNESTWPVFVIEQQYNKVVFHVTWTEGDSEINLLTPGGTKLTATEALTETNGVKELKLEKEAYFVLPSPALGTYQIEYDPNLVTGLQLEALNINLPPVLTFTQINYDAAQKTAQITWQAADQDDNAAITLYYDDDREGANGILFATDLGTSVSEGVYQWDLSAIPTGDYYIYAKIDDGSNAPVIVYSDTIINHIHPHAPAPPSNLSAVPHNGGLDITWQNASGVTTCQVNIITANDQRTLIAFLVENSQSYHLDKDAISPGEYIIQLASLSADGVYSAFAETNATVTEATPPVLEPQWSNSTSITANS